MAKETLIYEPKRIISGSVIGKKGHYVAIPDTKYKGNRIEVRYNGRAMLIKDWYKAETYRVFKDKWGRGNYTLAYFKWKPEPNENE